MENQLCKQIEPNLDAFHDGELTGDERTAVEKHLAACPLCLGKLAEIDRVVHTLRTMPKMALPEGLSARLDKIVEQPARDNVAAFKPQMWAVLAAAAAAVVLFVGVHFAMPGNNSSAPTVAAKPEVISPTTPRQPETMVSPIAEKPSVPQPGSSTGHHEKDQQLASAPNSSTIETGHGKHRSAMVRPELAARPNDLQQPHVVTNHATPAISHESEVTVAELPANNSSLTEAIGIATDEDGLYDIKM